jgi:hypothetical protein
MQRDVQQARATLAGRAAAAGTLANFNAACDRLAQHANARDNFMILLWKITQDPVLLEALSSAERVENRETSTNQLHSVTNTDPSMPQHRQQMRGRTPPGMMDQHISSLL